MTALVTVAARPAGAAARRAVRCARRGLAAAWRRPCTGAALPAGGAGGWRSGGRGSAAPLGRLRNRNAGLAGLGEAARGVPAPCKDDYVAAQRAGPHLPGRRRSVRWPASLSVLRLVGGGSGGAGRGSDHWSGGWEPTQRDARGGLGRPLSSARGGGGGDRGLNGDLPKPWPRCRAQSASAAAGFGAPLITAWTRERQLWSWKAPQGPGAALCHRSPPPVPLALRPEGAAPTAITLQRS